MRNVLYYPVGSFDKNEKNFYLPSQSGISVCKNFTLFRKMHINTNQLNSSVGFSERNEEKQYPFSENPTGKKRGFLHKNSLGLSENRFYLLKHIIRREVNHNFYICRGIRRKIKKLFTIVGKTIFRLYFPLFYGISFMKSAIKRFAQHNRGKIW